MIRLVIVTFLLINLNDKLISCGKSKNKYAEDQQSCREYGGGDVYPGELYQKSHSLHISKVQSK